MVVRVGDDDDGEDNVNKDDTVIIAIHVALNVLMTKKLNMTVFLNRRSIEIHFWFEQSGVQKCSRHI